MQAPIVRQLLQNAATSGNGTIVDLGGITRELAFYIEWSAGGGNAFTMGLSATGIAPTTHYWCNWQLQPNERTTLLGLLMGLPLAAIKVTSWDLDDVDPQRGQPTPQAVLQTMGLKVIGRVVS